MSAYVQPLESHVLPFDGAVDLNGYAGSGLHLLVRVKFMFPVHLSPIHWIWYMDTNIQVTSFSMYNSLVSISSYIHTSLDWLFLWYCVLLVVTNSKAKIRIKWPIETKIPSFSYCHSRAVNYRKDTMGASRKPAGKARSGRIKKTSRAMPSEIYYPDDDDGFDQITINISGLRRKISATNRGSGT